MSFVPITPTWSEWGEMMVRGLLKAKPHPILDFVAPETKAIIYADYKWLWGLWQKEKGYHLPYRTFLAWKPRQVTKMKREHCMFHIFDS